MKRVVPPSGSGQIPSLPFFHMGVIATLLGANLLFAGCVSSKYRAASTSQGQPVEMKLELGGTPVKGRLDAIIIYQGPGSWKKSAYWDELLVTLVNDTADPVTLVDAGLVDYFGTVMPAGTDPWKLEKDSRLQRDRYLDAGVNFALNTLGYVALTYGAVATGAVTGATLTGSWGGMAAGGMAGLVAVPVTAVVVFANNVKHRHAIEREFDRRRITLPLALGPGEARSGSLFFPMAVGPRSLRLGWSSASATGTSLLPLSALAGLHRTNFSPP
jgi:hypothetical protein